MKFENDKYRYYSCGCYRWGVVTTIDGRGSDLCQMHYLERSSDLRGAILLAVFVFLFVMDTCASHPSMDVAPCKDPTGEKK